jgi:S-adenosylmethionine/arginine decarboxylase-like enzyme
MLPLVESLGYGTLLIVDGFKAEADNLTNVATIEACLREVAGLLESTQAEVVSLETGSGSSATLRLPESHVSLHTFNSSNSLSLRVFSRHDLRPGEITDLLEKHFSVRRVESYLSSRSRTMPSDTEARQRVLLGERNYCALRLAPAFQ